MGALGDGVLAPVLQNLESRVVGPHIDDAKRLGVVAMHAQLERCEVDPENVAERAVLRKYQPRFEEALVNSAPTLLAPVAKGMGGMARLRWALDLASLVQADRPMLVANNHPKRLQLSGIARAVLRRWALHMYGTAESSEIPLRPDAHDSVVLLLGEVGLYELGSPAAADRVQQARLERLGGAIAATMRFWNWTSGELWHSFPTRAQGSLQRIAKDNPEAEFVHLLTQHAPHLEDSL